MSLQKAKELALEFDLVTPLRLVGKTEDEVRDIIIEEVTQMKKVFEDALHDGVDTFDDIEGCDDVLEELDA